ncbi:hypothetical protein GCM10010151_71720 [Actinoallomurus spadix]|uniref:Peptidase C51 domain-containing protein n=1 Tax=Actinoallomurus spadix TaxID=79912 RepID=A0ABN0XS30_9ACTN
MKNTPRHRLGRATAIGALALSLTAGPGVSTAFADAPGAATASTASTSTATASSAQMRAGLVARILSTARSQIGYREHGNNCTKYGPCEEWCSLFATWVWRKAGVKIPKYAFTGDVYRWGQRNHVAWNKHWLKTAQPGDVLLFGTGPKNTHTSTHIGIVESVSRNKKTVTLIEGNAGNAVRRKKHKLSGSIFYGGVDPIGH